MPFFSIYMKGFDILDQYEQFFADLAPSVTKICRQYGFPSCVCLAQMALESMWGQAVIGEYNYFGRKWNGWGNYIELPTQECYEGEWVTVNAKFQDYEDLEQAIDDWCILINEEECYVECKQYVEDWQKFVEVLAPIYATDPEYSMKLISTINANDLTQYN